MTQYLDETRLFALIDSGCSLRDVAEQLGCSHATVAGRIKARRGSPAPAPSNSDSPLQKPVTRMGELLSGLEEGDEIDARTLALLRACAHVLRKLAAVPPCPKCTDAMAKALQP